MKARIKTLEDGIKQSKRLRKNIKQAKGYGCVERMKRDFYKTIPFWRLIKDETKIKRERHMKYWRIEELID